MHDIVSTFGFVNCIWRQLCDYRDCPGIILAHTYIQFLSSLLAHLLSLALLVCLFLCELVELSGLFRSKSPRMRLFFPCSILISLSRTGPGGNLQCRSAMEEPVAEHLVPLKCKPSEQTPAVSYINLSFAVKLGSQKSRTLILPTNIKYKDVLTAWMSKMKNLFLSLRQFIFLAIAWAFMDFCT